MQPDPNRLNEIPAGHTRRDFALSQYYSLKAKGIDGPMVVEIVALVR